MANTVDVATTETSLRFTSLLAITTGTRNKTKKREQVTLKYNRQTKISLMLTTSKYAN